MHAHTPHTQTAPTPFPIIPEYGLVLKDVYAPDAITVPTRRRELVAAATEETEVQRQGQGLQQQQQHHRGLAMTPVQACFAACNEYYAPPPGNLKFLFQLVNNGQTCQCCKTCETFLPQQGALLMETCVPNGALRLATSLSRKFIKVNGAKATTLTYTLRVRSTVPSVVLEDMGVEMTLPAGASVVSHQPTGNSRSKWVQDGMQVAVNGSHVAWYPLTLGGTKVRTFRVKLTLRAPFGVSELRFQSEIVQNARGLAAASYCPLAAPEVRVAVKYP